MKEKSQKKVVEHRKYERVFEYDDCTVIFRYDTSKTLTGPFESEIKYKKVKK